MKNKQPKIVIVGVGDAVSPLIDNLSHEMTNENVKFVKVGFRFGNKNSKVTEIKLTDTLPRLISPEKIFEHLDNPKHKPHLEKIIAIMKEGDELYEMVEGTCIVFHRGYRLVRDGKIIMQLVGEEFML